ncbi:molybdate transport system ATP-binding protein [Catalinimonas alkaloidigena]|uniref:Molybdate transport system ATP-binding protein n=1 Tax=Catalinimonas alkaloidigena TaxID=1075417 RepID=A0A1G9AP93_9BACT|nr:ATP-binding cassette domain-containing protein [Catalinimonas alkaloidigena]SDK29097.1 molybdate transport system ATP-binding protein [Catalinimonas alkaloidigena]
MVVSCDAVTVSRAGVTWLPPVSWQLQPGEHWVIRGDNGAGKTTLLRVIAGKLTPTHGHVAYAFVTEHDWEARYRQVRAHVVYLPAHAFAVGQSSLYYQQRYYATGNEDVPTVESFLGDLVEAVRRLGHDHFDLTPLLPLKVTYLSNGQLRKLILLRALAAQPHLLLLDYPYEGLDEPSRADLNRLLEGVVAASQTQLVLTDHHHHLPSFINRTLVLDKPSGTTPPQSNGVLPPVAVAGAPIVKLTDIRLQYGEKILLAGFHWTIRQGEKWVLMGPNGSGKSTILALLNADSPQGYHNQVELFGRPRGTGESIWDIKRRINFLAPELLTYGYANTPRNQPVAAFLQQRTLAVHTEPVAEARWQAMLAWFGLEALWRQTMASVSTGQFQVLLLIKAFAVPRDLYILDEPFQYLDPTHKQQAFRFVQHYLPAEAALILVSHYHHDVPDYVTLWKRIGYESENPPQPH